MKIETHSRRLSTLCFIGIIVLFFSGTLVGCGDNFIEGSNHDDGIKSIVISFTGDPIESYSYKLTEEDNIREALIIYEKLKTYKSPKISTWFEDVTYEIEGNDGKIKKTTFKKIRPVSDIFERIFTSLEVREQAVSILAVDISEIAKIEMFSAKTGEKVVCKESNDIDPLMLSLKEFYRSDQVLSDLNFTLAEVELFNINDEYIGGGFIYREDKPTQTILDKQGIIDELIVNPSDIEFMILTKGNSKIEISDMNIIQIVLDNYQGYHTGESIMSVEYHLKETKGKRIDWHGSFLKNTVPKEIENMFLQ